jgi:hypothetical protein
MSYIVKTVQNLGGLDFDGRHYESRRGMHACVRHVILFAVASGLALAQTGTPDPFKELKFRSIGPFRGGRVVAVAGVPSQPSIYYFGGTGGGVFKTTDGGDHWESVTDGQIKTGSVGAIAVAESDPNVIYAGMGEGCIRGNASHGDGVYKSTDAGRTWKHIGLENTQQIGRVRVHPKNADNVYVAALHRWRQVVEESVLQERQGRCNRSDSGSNQSKYHLRFHLGNRSQAVDV